MREKERERDCVCSRLFHKQPNTIIWGQTERLAHHWAAAEQSTSFCGLPKLVKAWSIARMEVVYKLLTLTKAKPENMFPYKTKRLQTHRHTHASFVYVLRIHKSRQRKGGGSRSMLEIVPFQLHRGRPAAALVMNVQQGDHSPRWKRRLKCVSAQTDWVQRLTQRCLNCGCLD